MATQERPHYGFKQITLDNWLTPDLPKSFPLLTADVWVPELLKPQAFRGLETLDNLSQGPILRTN